MISAYCSKSTNTVPVARHMRDHLVVTIAYGGSGSSG